MGKRKWITEHVVLRDCEILYRDFTGTNNPNYNERAIKNFCVYIDDEEVAKSMIEDGWNVRVQEPSDEGGTPRYYTQVNINYNSSNPPAIWQCTSMGMTLLNEETVVALQSAKILKVDLDIAPYNWGPDDGKHGVKGYVDVMYVTIKEDPFYAEYFAKYNGSKQVADDEVPFDLE